MASLERQRSLAVSERGVLIISLCLVQPFRLLQPNFVILVDNHTCEQRANATTERELRASNLGCVGGGFNADNDIDQRR